MLTKSELRKDVLKLRGAMSPEELKVKSDSVISRLQGLDEYRQARVVMAYVDFRNEVQTGALIESCLTGGKRICVPITDIAAKVLTPSEIKDFPGDLVPGAWGILEPRQECVRPLDPGEIDLVVVPGVAFDTNGDRLGYGGGFYDRFLPRTRTGTVFVALAFELQVRDNVYPGPHDCPMHILLTEERVLRFKS